MPHPANNSIVAQAQKLAYLPIKAYEGLYSKVPNGYKPVSPNVADNTTIYAYYDGLGIPTIGWGTTHYPNGKKVSINDSITKKYADELLVWENEEKAKKVLELVNVPINAYLLASLISATFNTGPGSKAKNNGFYGSPLRKVINSGADAKTIAQTFIYHIPTAGGKLDKGLVKRRLGEARFSLGMSDFYIEVNDPRFLKHWKEYPNKWAEFKKKSSS